MLILSQHFELYAQPIEENFITDFTSDKINQLVTKVKKIKKTYDNNIRQIEQKLSASGIDVQKIKKDAKTAAGKSSSKNGKTPNLKDAIKTFTNDLVHKKYLINNDERQVQVKQSTEVESTSVAGGILKSVGVLAAVVFINTFFIRIVVSSTGSVAIAGLIVGIVVAPLVEEASKLISVKNNFTWEYFTIFNLYEFTSYVILLVSQLHLNPITAILVRLPALAMHLINTLIHVDAKERDDSNGGYKVTVAIHAIFNTLAPMLISKFI